MTPYLAMIVIFGFNFPPKGWAACNGQLLPINQNQALFALLGTFYGGNGIQTFALPDLRGRVPISMGNTGSQYQIGIPGGTENVTLTTAQMPAHNHLITGSADLGDTANPQNAFPANTGVDDREYKLAATNAVVMNSRVVNNTGGNQPFSVLQPYLALNFCIALQGIFPSRN